MTTGRFSKTRGGALGAVTAVLVVVSLLGFCLTAHAARLRPRYRVLTPDLTCEQNRWHPLAVFCQGETGGMTGTLAVYGLQSVGANDYVRADEIAYSRRVAIPPGSKKIVHLYYRLDPSASHILIELRDARGRPIWSKRKVARRGPGDHQVFCLGQAQVMLNFFAGARDLGGKSVKCQPFPPMALPDRWIGYDGADTVAVYNHDLNDLTPAQQAALKQWVQAGGNLLVFFSGNAAVHRLGIFRDLLPLRVTGAREITGFSDLGKIAGQKAADELAGARAAVAAGKPRGGRALASQGDTPLILMRPEGLGSVVYVAFDIGRRPFRGLPGSRRIARLILGGKGTKPYTGRDRQMNLPQFVGSVLRNVKALKTPSFLGIGLYLGLYIILIAPVNYFVLRRLGRKEWSIFTIPALVILFSAGSYFVGVYIKGGEVWLKTLSVCRMRAGHRAARVDTYVGLFSPGLRRYEITAKPESAWRVFDFDPPHRRRRSSRRKPAVFDQTEGFRVTRARVPMWDMRDFHAERMQDIGAAECSLSLQTSKNELSGSIRSHLGFDLSHASVVIGPGVAYPVGRVPGGGKEIRLDGVRVAARGSTALEGQLKSMVAQSRQWQWRNGTWQILGPRCRYASGAGGYRAVLVGLAEKPLTEIRVRGEQPERDHKTIVVTELSVPIRLSAGKPPPVFTGKVTGALAQESSLRVESDGTLHFWGGDSYAVLEFPLPSPSEGYRLALLQLKGGNQTASKAFLWRCDTAKWVPFPYVRLEVKEPGAYVDPVRGCVQVKIKCSGSVSMSAPDLHYEMRRK